jgi:hypothetical protein
VEDEAIKYKEPLPVELLPFEERNDKFTGIGTAFAVSPTRFVTAAHVIPANGTSLDRYYLRDVSGATYEIGRIIKYSQYRDIVEFELAQAPGNVVPFEPRATVDIGEPVFTVGNARGEGVVFRSGSITSFTSESISGAWKFLRFTAPASPGNSGGPLVDASGRVLGVVVRKSEAENLNYAVPIGELDKLSSNQSEFWIKGIPVSEDHKRFFADWRFSSPLPASLMDLRGAARQSFRNTLTQWLTEFDSKFSNEVFPKHPTLSTYLREAYIPFGLGNFALDGNEKWSVAGTNYVNKELAPGQKAYFFEGPEKRAGELVLDRPPDLPLSKFYESPRLLSDAIVRNYSWGITFAGKRIGIETLGDPSDHERWVDEYGRPWFTWVWRIKRSDEALIFDCLTNPGGWACRWKKVPIALEEGMRLDAKRIARRTTFSYYGRIKDWVEFLALPEEYRPKLLASAVVRLDKKLSFDLAPFSGSVDVPSLTETSTLYAFGRLDPMSLSSQRITEMRIVPVRDKGYSYGVEEIFEPVAQSSEKHTQLWKNLQAGNRPFDNVFALDGKTNAIRRVVKRTSKMNIGSAYIEYCRSGTEDPKAELQSSCSNFQQAIQIAQSQ